MKIKYSILITFIFIFKTCYADQTDDLSSREPENNCKLISKKDAMEKAENKHSGKVVSIKLDSKGKKSTYKVRVLVGEKRIKNLTIKACK